MPQNLGRNLKQSAGPFALDALRRIGRAITNVLRAVEIYTRSLRLEYVSVIRRYKHEAIRPHFREQRLHFSDERSLGFL
jgi:hypothetical protein